TDNYVNGAPAVDQKRVVFGGCDGMLRVLSSMGKETLRVNVDSHIAASPAVSDGIAYLGQYQGVAMAVDLATGKILWKHGGGQESEPFLAPPALDDKRMYIGSRDKSMHCLDRKTGERIWTFRTRGQIEGAAVVGSGRLIFGSADGMLYVLDAKTGGKMFAFEIGAGISSSPAIANGCVLVTAEDGTLYAFTAVANDN
ncbi:MAG: PQQ-like beta-propeller repeat protein, partial [Lentisphaeria bacterium]|nr:PQQ-like beta-propeller repeat protein [Lentisphaeria bacterium]